MKNYLLSIYQPEGPPPPDVLREINKEVEALRQEMKGAGVWVFSDGLHAPSTGTVVRLHGGDVLMTDGPFAESKEHVGGLLIIRAPDLDAALAWAKKTAKATTLPVEVRPFLTEAEG